MLPYDRYRRRIIRFQAKMLAKGGQCRSWRDIETALTNQGRPGAAEALRSPLIRFALDRACKRATARRARDPNLDAWA